MPRWREGVSYCREKHQWKKETERSHGEPKLAKFACSTEPVRVLRPLQKGPNLLYQILHQALVTLIKIELSLLCQIPHQDPIRLIKIEPSLLCPLLILRKDPSLLSQFLSQDRIRPVTIRAWPNLVRVIYQNKKFPEDDRIKRLRILLDKFAGFFPLTSIEQCSPLYDRIEELRIRLDKLAGLLPLTTVEQYSRLDEPYPQGYVPPFFNPKFSSKTNPRHHIAFFMIQASELQDNPSQLMLSIWREPRRSSTLVLSSVVDLLRVKQRENEAFSLYFSRWRAVYLKFAGPLPTNEAIEMIIEEAEPHYRDFFSCDDTPNDFKSLVKLGVRFQNWLERRNHNSVELRMQTPEKSRLHDSNNELRMLREEIEKLILQGEVDKRISNRFTLRERYSIHHAPYPIGCNPPIYPHKHKFSGRGEDPEPHIFLFDSFSPLWIRGHGRQLMRLLGQSLEGRALVWYCQQLLDTHITYDHLVDRFVGHFSVNVDLPTTIGELKRVRQKKRDLRLIHGNLLGQSLNMKLFI
ncbi:hypothetical protein AMTR_s00048p00154440 [Amborella trichopoda]|uniref:Retrotransposon gag domain-containing protein n=1 Tax=Amborella trichopoda TaxID=13333 RepID=U5D045_AMBTC|nr:hypothetical protein AMTR_s00048p00154440 [Amborella trichopoda]